MELPPRRTRRYELVKFIYTTDNNESLVTGQFHYKDENGVPFFELSSRFLSRVVTGRSREKFWGNPDRLRKAEVQYPEPRNQNGVGSATLYIPDNPDNGTKETFLEIRDIVYGKFAPFNQRACVNYRGENRFTRELPSRVNEVIQ
ncbi:hypothetical protein AA637_11865 [Cyanobacterium sp. HL-69]|uniref:hypothetical protein n=1 Tax=Cyanobacterium sp. HL-69 TaxID=2054282 RepID=UPI000CA2C1B4|nr:hypothetical protein AA637_11865 [Cyanobacterium sp. HL-69]